jgi:predicted nucleic acid-binding protein
MIVVVADTSPLNYLIQIHCQDLLPTLYGRVLVPAAVIAELEHPASPAEVRAWLGQRPAWIVIGQPKSLTDAANAFPGLDPGEREAIQLALEAEADLLLMDEKLGVRLARRQGLKVLGTLGVLVQAAIRGLVDINSSVDRLRATDFRCTPQLFERAKQQVASARARS